MDKKRTWCCKLAHYLHLVARVVRTAAIQLNKTVSLQFYFIFTVHTLENCWLGAVMVGCPTSNLRLRGHWFDYQLGHTIQWLLLEWVTICRQEWELG